MAGLVVSVRITALRLGTMAITLPQSNLKQVLPQLAHKALIIQDVKDAVAAGKIVTTRQSAVNHKSWTGVGYSIVDPQTDAGAYLIGGGAILIAVGFLIISWLIAEFVSILGASGVIGGLTLAEVLYLVALQPLGTFFSAITLIATGLGCITRIYVTCQWYRYALSGVITVLTGIWIFLAGAAAGLAYGGFSDFLGANLQCLKGRD